jgi:hypothetical protein
MRDATTVLEIIHEHWRAECHGNRARPVRWGAVGKGPGHRHLAGGLPNVQPVREGADGKGPTPRAPRRRPTSLGRAACGNGLMATSAPRRRPTPRRPKRAARAAAWARVRRSADAPRTSTQYAHRLARKAGVPGAAADDSAESECSSAGSQPDRRKRGVVDARRVRHARRGGSVVCGYGASGGGAPAPGWERSSAGLRSVGRSSAIPPAIDPGKPTTARRASVLTCVKVRLTWRAGRSPAPDSGRVDGKRDGASALAGAYLWQRTSDCTQKIAVRVGDALLQKIPPTRLALRFRSIHPIAEPHGGCNHP